MIRLPHRRVSMTFFVFALLLSSPFATTATAQTPVVDAPMPALPVTVTDATGEDVTVEDVSRIIPLNGNIAETIFALGLGSNVVATDTSALYPEEALALPKIGYQRELNAEGILAMSPTVVIGDQGAGPPEVLDQVRAAGVPVVILESEETVEGPPALIRSVGETLGIPEEADVIAANVDQTLDETAALIAEVDESPRVAFLYIRGQGTQLISGTNTSADVVISAAGGVNAGADSGTEGYFPITPEALVEAAPDVILVMQGGLASVGGVDGLLQIPGVSQTPAGEAERIVAFEDLYLLGFGPRIGDAIYDLALALHPELDGEPRNPQWQGTDVAAPDEASPEASPAA